MLKNKSYKKIKKNNSNGNNITSVKNGFTNLFPKKKNLLKYDSSEKEGKIHKDLLTAKQILK